jgi:hypothetical protein
MWVCGLVQICAGGCSFRKNWCRGMYMGVVGVCAGPWEGMWCGVRAFWCRGVHVVGDDAGLCMWVWLV